ncbi:hypothetical protein DXG01_004673 [Tephrocybe rancida]|nr:hypothetical protein DXG01_004673 [Tephrocybe rancida]
MDLFQKNIKNLWEQFESAAVSDEVSVTCDAWQAGNTDTYYAVTSCWIEETSIGVWEEKSVLFGFTLMNTAHDGKRLGHALFRIACRLGITTKAVISVYSPAKHFNTAKPEEHEPDTKEEGVHDEVGIIQTIVVKVRSSAKHKEIFKNIQVQWSSTYIMLRRALLLRKCLNDFLSKIQCEEPSYDKCNKLDALMLSKDEWEHVRKFVKVLDLPDRAQQAFSAENVPTLHNGIPALEALHSAWSSLKDYTRYSEFWEALTAGLEKIEAYYEKTADSLLDSNTKMMHFKKHWSTGLQDEILASAKKIFKERYIDMYGSETALQTQPTSSHSKIAQLLAENSSGDKSDSEAPAVGMSPGQGSELWHQEFNQYLNSIDTVPDGMTLAHWWGEPAPSSLDEMDLEDIYDDDRDPDWVDVECAESWDVLINVDDDVDDD